MKPALVILSLLLAASSVRAGASVEKNTVPPPDDRWKVLLAIPGWMPAIEGNVGINGLTSHIDLAPGTFIHHYDMALTLRGEASKGRFGIMGDLLYTSMSDGVGTKTVVKKIDLQVDQTIAELALRWRLIDQPRGSLDVIGGVRYTNLFQQVATHASEQRIGEASTRIVDAVSELKSAWEKWIALKPFDNPAAPPHPFGPEFYTPRFDQEIHDTLAGVQRINLQAKAGGSNASGYLSNTVLLAMVLFFAGTAGKFDHRNVRRPSLGFAVALFLWAAVRVFMLPVA